MPERPQPDRAPEDDLPDQDSPPHPAEPLQLDTPLIDMGSATRVSTSGLRLEPKMDSADLRDFAQEDAAALDAIEKFEKSLRRQPLR